MQLTIDKLKNGDHVTIVALGDSITSNSLHNRGYMNWVSLLDTALHQTYGYEACTLINAGVPESSYRQALQRIERDVLRFAPDAVIVALGMNDWGRGMEGLPQFKREVRQTIDTIRSRCGSDLLLMTPNPIVADTGMTWPWRDGVNPGEIHGDEQLGAYAHALVEVGAEKQCVVIDNYRIWKSYRPSFEPMIKKEWLYQYTLWPRMANSTHPGPLGHVAFYRELAKIFQTPEYLGWEIG